MKAYERLLKYVTVDTQSDPESTSSPSAEKEKDLSVMLVDELAGMGIKGKLTSTGYVYAKIPGNTPAPSVGFIAHVDTAQGISGKNVKPRIVKNWDGKDIKLNDEYTIKVSDYPKMATYVGKSLMVTDGTTLLGADDKAGVAEIMTLAEVLTSNPTLPHGDVWLAFTPDEEIGRGTDNFDLKEFQADFAYTLDGDAINGIDYENFNAASADVEVKGFLVHTGSAKDKMINSMNIAIEFHNLLPYQSRPEYTENREGFFHLDEMQGDVEKTVFKYLIRNHDKKQFEQMKRLMIEDMNYLNNKYPSKPIKVVIKDTYANMRDCFAGKMEIIELASEALKRAGLQPVSVPMRGGTDGANLTYQGLLCPNLGTGCGNYHGRYEYAVIDDMETMVEVVTDIVTKLAKSK